MGPGDIRNFYILYIGAGAVATGGIISMARAMPVILGARSPGFRDLRAARQAATADDRSRAAHRARSVDGRRHCSAARLLVLLLDALAHIWAWASRWHGLLGAVLVVVFGFLFVTVSSRLTGEIGSSSNPISGMTVATLLLTCLIFLALGKTTKLDTLTALTIAGVVCIAASNGGTTAQDLKTGFLVGATPQVAADRHPDRRADHAPGHRRDGQARQRRRHALHEKSRLLADVRRPGRGPAERSTADAARAASRTAKTTQTVYRVLNVGRGRRSPGVAQGKYLVDDHGVIRYREDPAINGLLPYDDIEAEKKARQDRGEDVVATPLPRYDAPKTKLMALIIDGILNQKLPWSLVLIGALMAVSLELCAVPSLPFAVGIYLPLQTSFPIFIGGVMRAGWSTRSTPPSRRNRNPAPACCSARATSPAARSSACSPPS